MFQANDDYDEKLALEASGPTEMKNLESSNVSRKDLNSDDYETNKVSNCLIVPFRIEIVDHYYQ